jgi:hypothetical protein
MLQCPIVCEYSASPRIINNTIEFSKIAVLGSWGLIEGNQFVNNTKGVYLCDGPILNNIFAGNLEPVVSCSGNIINNTLTLNLGKAIYNCVGLIQNNTIVQNEGNGIEQCSGQIINNIIAYNSGAGIVGPSNNNYNCIWSNNPNFSNSNAKVGDIGKNPFFVRLGSWNDNGTPNYSSDDFFTLGDYHLKSTIGRFDPDANQWVTDTISSPCIDAGDPADTVIYEPNPNGGRINMGAYGGTAEASKSPTGIVVPFCQNPPRMDFTNDCKVDLADFAVFASDWLACGIDPPSACSQ